MTTVTVSDATHANIAHLPAGQAAGYVTGSPDVQWTAQDFAAHPGAVRIDQSPVNTALDETADVLDFENGAATLADIVPWVKAARANYASAARPGQRSPVIYVSSSNLTAVANALAAAGISGTGLWIADWTGSENAAAAAVEAASGSFPVVGWQYRNAGLYDVSVFSSAWLSAVSVAKPPVPPGQWNDPSAWTWEQAMVTGVGLDGQLHAFKFAGSTWTKLA